MVASAIAVAVMCRSLTPEVFHDVCEGKKRFGALGRS